MSIDIVGLLDTGIYAAHPSFDNYGIPPPPARWKGSCQGSAARCNKLIGTMSFVEDNSMYDIGHGTHTSSTAAGNFASGAYMKIQEASHCFQPYLIPFHLAIDFQKMKTYYLRWYKPVVRIEFFLTFLFY